MKHLPMLHVVMAASIAFSIPAFAEKGGNGHGKNKHAYKEEKAHSGKVYISGPDRVVIQQYIAQDYRSHCPPGLAKKHNGCLPPGQAKKQYVIGQPLVVGWEPVPQPLLVRLQPVPAGYRYVMVDKDVLLISEASKHVIDAITLMSAVGN